MCAGVEAARRPLSLRAQTRTRLFSFYFNSPAMCARGSSVTPVHTKGVEAMRVKTPRALAALVLCGHSTAISPPSPARAITNVNVNTLIVPSPPERVSQRQQTGTCASAPATKQNHGRSEDDLARASPLRLFGLGGGESSSTSRGSAGGASQARRAVEANSEFKSRMAKVSVRDITQDDSRRYERCEN